MTEQLYFKYWGKAENTEMAESMKYHLLPYHCLDVAAVGWFLMDTRKPRCQRLSAHLDVHPEWLRRFFTFCLVLHDLGKFSRAFQGLQTNLSPALVSTNQRMPYTERHDNLGYRLWNNSLAAQVENRDKNDRSWLRKIRPWLEIVFGHHGIPPNNSGERLTNFFETEDEEATSKFTCDTITFFLADFDPAPLFDKKLLKKLKLISWQLAGITVLADWMGSNKNHFKYYWQTMPLADYWYTIALTSAKQAMQELPQKPEVSRFTSINDLFSFIETPTPLQEYATNEPLAEAPQLFILEDVTGAGKTEAALVLTHRILSAGLADGLYVALPTMATANAMYQRLGEVYQCFYKRDDMPSLILAHGARQLSKEFRQSVTLAENVAEDSNYSNDLLVGNQDLSATVFCNAWLADSRKKALLADVGVGTIDQALLAILPSRHQSLRLLGLGRKVLLVDEVHAYDPYMFKLLETLLEFHAKQGGSVILLSATLPHTMRENLVTAFGNGLGREPSMINSQAYPLATHIPTEDIQEQHIDTRAEVKRTVEVRRLDSQKTIIEQIEQAVKQGKCVCWIRNTVQEARNSYQELAKTNWLERGSLHLFHSRFAMIDRQKIEAETLERFGKNSNHEKRKGQVLVATQVVEQSLDLDFDLMITDLAPIDLIIQRAGRLCRHMRDLQGNQIIGADGQDKRGKPVLLILAPVAESDADENWLKTQQPGTQAVYPHIGRLWLTTRLLFGSGEQGHFSMPGDARTLVEGVYSPEAEETIPELLQEISWDADGKDMMQLSIAHLNVLKLSKGYTRRSGEWDEENRIPTRLTESETVSVVLVLYHNGKFEPYAGNVYMPWAMSTVKIPEREWRAAKNSISSNMASLIEELQTEEKALRWLEVFPLYDETDHYYKADHGWQPEGV